MYESRWEGDGQVSRLFSAMLQLVNNGNVEILREEADFKLKLLEDALPTQDFSDTSRPLAALVGL